MPAVDYEIANGTIFFDRIASLVKESSKGESITRGGEEGGIKLRIVQKGENPPFLTIHFFSLLVLHAKITTIPIQLNEEERKMSLWLMDVSGGREENRKFILEFYDDLSSWEFEKACRTIGIEASKKQDKEVLEKEEAEVVEHKKHQSFILDLDSSDDEADASLFHSPFDDVEDTCNETENEVDGLDLGTFNFNVCESQDLYNPILPYGHTK